MMGIIHAGACLLMLRMCHKYASGQYRGDDFAERTFPFIASAVLAFESGVRAVPYFT